MIRIFDFVISFIALVLLSPLFLIIMVILKFTGENEVFYLQKRVGKDGKEFGLLKFATMVKNSTKIGSKEITIPNDPRVLPFGKFLRKSKINELPQIWNVLNGDISIVGPRPMVPNTYRNYPKEHQKILNKVHPGLTGVGSIIFRDEEKFLIVLIKNRSLLENKTKKNDKLIIVVIIVFLINFEVWNTLTLNLGAIK